MKKALVFVATFALVGFAGEALAEKQPHMKRALELLERAEHQLKEAEANKGGHRVKALEHVNNAIDEVKKGIAFDNAD